MNKPECQASDPAPAETTGARRKVRLTSKAFENKLNLVLLNVNKNFSSLRECIDKINALMCNDDYSVVKEFNLFVELCDKFVQDEAVFNELFLRSKTEGREDYKDIATCYEERREFLHKCMERFVSWLNASEALQSEKVNEVVADDNQNVVPIEAKDLVNPIFKGNDRSSKEFTNLSLSDIVCDIELGNEYERITLKCSPSLQEQKLYVALRKAELPVKKDAVRAKRELQLAQLELQCKVSELEIDTEVKISEAKLNILNEELRLENSQDININNDARNSTEFIFSCDAEAKNISSSMRNSSPVKFMDLKSDGSYGQHPYNYDGNEMLAQTSRLVNELRKPVCEIRKFSGNPLEYKSFLRQFRSKVTQYCQDCEECMSYLEQFTEGEANKIV